MTTTTTPTQGPSDFTVSQIVMLPYDPKDHVRTSQSIGFQIGGVRRRDRHHDAGRARVLPKKISIALIIGGLIGFSWLLAPFAIPLALAVIAMGIWFIRNGDLRPSRPSTTH